ncbi:protein NUCLEAR FUSION DEFECTIVE 4-like [Selaginella moellendorffii]|uniref:protein NUCLEAR FUSION DEFECTIVE 4-like n=1 Tax=Selaginella moellendorffii TaxID=88036 RepID=UPI000D1CA199|nr:protein NUCLEAR FUSION DEFECTIVE 4-like [Selaginella moellendorffii]|eukprot:XP_024517024.1 protein NUCLEAR FUSION DEFECTIVE 4-like [Selaginella moellendorffii]
MEPFRGLKLLRNIARNKWMAVVATFFIMATAGATYSFGLYSQKMKTTLGYSQKTISTIALFKDLGAKVGLVSGLIYDVTGPWVVLGMGAVLNTLGFLMIWLALTRRISAPQIWQMCLYIFLGTNSQSFTNTGVVVTCVKNFPNNRGFLIGLLKGFVGLSGAILTMAYEAIYGTKDPANFVLLLTWLPPSVCLLFMFFVRRTTPSGEDQARVEKRIAYVFFVISVSLAMYLMVIIIVKNLDGVVIPRWVIQLLAVVMLVIILLPLGVVLKQELQGWKGGTVAQEQHPDYVRTDEQQEQQQGKELEEVPAKGLEGPSEVENLVDKRKNWSLRRIVHAILTRPPRGEDYTIPEGIFSIDMLLIFVCTTCGFGTGLAVYDNLGQIGDSLRYSHEQVGTFVQLLSIWNFLGRVTIGLVSDIFLQKFQVPRPFFFALTLGLSALGQLFLALNFKSALFMSSILIGFGYGAQLVLMYILTSEFFGLKYYGTLYNVCNMASPLGSYVFSVKIAGELYDKEALKQQNSGGDHHGLLCYGARCYRRSFIISTATCVFGVLVALVLTLRTRKFYKELALKLGKRR